MRGDISGKNVSEIAGWHRKSDWHIRAAKLCGGGKIIGGLCHHPRPIDRIDPGQIQFLAKFAVIEHRFHQRLTIVKRAVDGQRMHIGICRRCHLHALDVRHAPLRIENENIDGVAAPKRFNGRPACITRRGADNRGALPAPSERVIHQAREQLHRHILERQRRPVEQFQQIVAVIQRHQWGDVDVRKTGISLIDNFGKSFRLHVTSQKRHQSGFGNVLKTGPAKTLQRLSRQFRPVIGHIKTPVTGQPSK